MGGQDRRILLDPGSAIEMSPGVRMVHVNGSTVDQGRPWGPSNINLFLLTFFLTTQDTVRNIVKLQALIVEWSHHDGSLTLYHVR